ncbi:MAG: hypothetical protein KDA61_22275, partial [Planctomycetales bacterium]|nr:hypothetical protein [Planctomycetales bacterium]
GTFRWTYDFDPGVGKEIHFSPSAREDAFVLKLDAFGAFEWAAQVGGDEVDIGLDVAVDEWGNVYATGGFKESVDFDPGPGVHELQSAGDYDVFVQSLEPNGRLQWAHRIGQDLRDVGNAIAVSARGRVYVAGGLGGSVSSGDLGEYVVVDADGDDAFLLEFPQDDSPSAFGDVYGAIAGGELAIEASKGVLANDEEFQHREMSAVLVSGPSHGELSLHANGAFAYTPAASFLGVDEFVYKVLADGIAGDTAVVKIYVAEKQDFASATGNARLFRDEVGSVVGAELSFDRELLGIDPGDFVLESLGEDPHDVRFDVLNVSRTERGRYALTGGFLPFSQSNGSFRLSLMSQSGVSSLDGLPLIEDVSVEWTQSPLWPGDVDADRRVGLDDFTTLKENFGSSGFTFYGPREPDLKGDLNGDGFVNLIDFNVLKANFGTADPNLAAAAVFAAFDDDDEKW